MTRKVVFFLILIGFIIGGYLAFTSLTLPNVRHALDEGVEPAATSQILANDNTVLMAYGRYHHKPIKLSQVAPVMVDALLSTEDRRFYQHMGIDPIGIARAVFRNLLSKGLHEGASTLTQQLARNIFLSNERSIERKVKEGLLALKIEHQLTKKEILELYLNNVYFGEGAYGIAAASQLYFGKPAARLRVEEAALLAGLPQAPSVYSPFVNKEKAFKRRNEVLDNMVENHKLDADVAESLKAKPIIVNQASYAAANRTLGAFFTRGVIHQVCDLLDMDEQTFWQQGLKVHTTLDPRAQKIAETAVATLSASYGRVGPKQQAALMSLDNDGQVIAYVGGKDFSESQFDRVTQAHRQAGSLFKVFVYTTAFELDYKPTTVYNDVDVTFDTADHWKPHNYDKKHHGPMTLARALASSNNVIASKLINDVTPDAVIQMAHRMGIDSYLRPNLSLALGSSDVTLKEMTSAFSVFANQGQWRQPHGIDNVVDKNNEVLYQFQPQEKDVLPAVTRDTMVAMMQGVIRFGTGKGATLGRPCAGKTGTSDDYRDAWFIGYTPDITTGVWVGNDDNSQMPGVTGGSLPAAIWKSYMSQLLASRPKLSFDLSSSLPLQDKDFFDYNLDNLAESEKGSNVSTTPPSVEDTMDNESGIENPISPDGPSSAPLPGQPATNNANPMGMPTDDDMNDAKPTNEIPHPKPPPAPIKPPPLTKSATPTVSRFASQTTSTRHYGPASGNPQDAVSASYGHSYSSSGTTKRQY